MLGVHRDGHSFLHMEVGKTNVSLSRRPPKWWFSFWVPFKTIKEAPSKRTHPERFVREA